MSSFVCTRADQLKAVVWSDFSKLIFETFVHNLAGARAAYEDVAKENEALRAENAELKKPKSEAA